MRPSNPSPFTSPIPRGLVARVLAPHCRGWGREATEGIVLCVQRALNDPAADIERELAVQTLWAFLREAEDRRSDRGRCHRRMPIGPRKPTDQTDDELPF